MRNPPPSPRALRVPSTVDAIPRFAGALGVPLFFLVAGCGDAAARSGDGAPTLAPDTVEVFRIGSVEGGRWDSFSEIVASGFDASGNLYLLDGRERKVTVADPRGGFVRTVGKPGDGPGEFRMPVGMAVLPDGTVVVSDAQQRGLLVFGPNGEYLRSIELGAGAGGPSILLAHGDDAVVFAASTVMRSPMMGGGASLPSDIPIHRVRVHGGGEIEVIHRAWLPPRLEPRVQSSGAGVVLTRQTRAFEPALHVTALPDGTVAVADSTTYRIELVAPGGGVSRTLTRAVAPTQVTEVEREQERARQLRELDGGGSPTGPAMGMGGGGAAAPSPAQVRAMREAQLENMVFWPEIQVVRELAADPEGRLWVRRFGGVDEPGPIELLGSDGAVMAVIPAGEMGLPAAFGPNGVAAWIEHDEFDVPFVRVARLDLP